MNKIDKEEELFWKFEAKRIKMIEEEKKEEQEVERNVIYLIAGIFLIFGGIAVVFIGLNLLHLLAFYEAFPNVAFINSTALANTPISANTLASALYPVIGQARIGLDLWIIIAFALFMIVGTVILIYGASWAITSIIYFFNRNMDRKIDERIRKNKPT